MKNQTPKLFVFINATSNAQLQRLEYIKHFQKKYSITLVCPNASDLRTDSRFDSIQLLDLNLSRSGTGLLTELKTIFQIYKTLKASPRDSISHCFTLKPILYVNFVNRVIFKNKLNVFSTFTGLGFVFTHRQKHKFLFHLIKHALKFSIYKVSSKIIFQNDDDQKLLEDLKITTSKTHLIYGSGVDTSLFKTKQVASKKHSHVTKYLFLGRLLLDKGLHECLKAFSIALSEGHSISLTIAGGLDTKNPKCISQTALDKHTFLKDINFIGHIQNVKEIIDAHDVVVLPSYREGVPLSLIQACSMSKPIFTTTAPGCNLTCDHKKNGFKVEPKSVEQLLEGIKYFQKLTPLELFEMGRKSRAKACLLFDKDVVNSKIEELYTSDQ